MKRYKSILIFAALLFAGFAPHAYAEEITPQFSITVDPDKSEVHYFDVYHGETVLFEVTFKRPSNETMTFFWQEQGMGDSYWSESCTTVGDGVYRAVFTPQMDTGAKVFNCFIGRPGMIYRAVFQLRMKQSPGALPNALPLPTPVIDFSRIHVLNPPWGSGGGGGCDTNAVDILANSAVVTNALTVATTNRVALLETATNDLSSSVSALASSKANKSALAAHIMDSRNPHGVTAEQVGAVSSLSPYSGPELIFSWEPNNSGIALSGNGSGIGLSVLSGVCGFYALHGNDYDWYQLPTGESGTLALKGDISATNPTFSNAVLAVQISTNDFAALYALKEAFADLPIDPVTGGISIGALLAALASAVAWLKKNKVGSFASVGGASATVENGVAKLGDFFTNSNSLLTGTIDARLPYPLNAVTDDTGLLKDRSINTTSLASVTVPDNFTDLLVRASVASSLSVTMPAAITKYGDTFPGEAGEYIITITKTGAAEAYVRTIKLEEMA